MIWPVTRCSVPLRGEEAAKLATIAVSWASSRCAFAESASASCPPVGVSSPYSGLVYTLVADCEGEPWLRYRRCTAEELGMPPGGVGRREEDAAGGVG